jgi:23S rRNA (guanosine2251-2'-O)-methyltransferase
MEVSPFQYEDFETLVDGALRASEPPFLLMLDHVHDPQNVGSMMRSAEVAGVHGVILARDNACGITPAVVRASSGAVEYLRVARVANIAETVRRLQQHGIRCLALEALPDARPLASCRLTGGVALVVGNEGEGVRPRVRKTCDEVVRLPVCGRIGSLNAAVAAAVAMFEVRRQREARASTTP